MTSWNELLKLIDSLLADQLAGDYTSQLGSSTMAPLACTGEMPYPGRSHRDRADLK